MSTQYYRLDFNLVYTAASGYRDWAKAHLDQRLLQSVAAINEGSPAFELCHVSTGEDEDGNPRVYGMVAFPLDAGGLDAQAYCKDAYDTLAATTPWMVSGGATSRLSYHVCDHENQSRKGCVPEESMNG